jgi:secreted PhoX family phosphatase
MGLSRRDFLNDIDDNEFTGPVYSLDRKILFANLQDPGTMFAITGPWRPLLPPVPGI